MKRLFRNLTCAVAVMVDFSLGRFTFSAILVVLALAAFCRIAFIAQTRRRDIEAGVTYSTWVLLIIALGFLSNQLAERESLEIAVAANKYKTASGAWPTSLAQLSGYKERVDERGRLRVYMSKFRLLNEAIVYNEFPSRWVNLSLASGRRERTDAW
jgi:hypothetical protein